MDFVATARGFLLEPKVAFVRARSVSISDSILYFILLLLINAILSVIVGLVIATAILSLVVQLIGQLGMGEVFLVETLGMVAAAIILVIVSFLFLFVAAGWLHIFVYLLGGRKGYGETLKVLAFGSTPFLLVGWIPLVGFFVGGVWTLVLSVLGIRELQQVSTARALGAVILAAVIPFILLVILAAYFFISPVSVVGPLS
ncbi:MAG: YIP1 family protein [Methanolinea sp.]|nr:YIP1 family protein [Methanolinea sp.]